MIRSLQNFFQPYRIYLWDSMGSRRLDGTERKHNKSGKLRRLLLFVWHYTRLKAPSTWRRNPNLGSHQSAWQEMGTRLAYLKVTSSLCHLWEETEKNERIGKTCSNLEFFKCRNNFPTWVAWMSVYYCKADESHKELCCRAIIIVLSYTGLERYRMRLQKSGTV